MLAYLNSLYHILILNHFAKNNCIQIALDQYLLSYKEIVSREWLIGINFVLHVLPHSSYNDIHLYFSVLKYKTSLV